MRKEAGIEYAGMFLRILHNVDKGGASDFILHSKFFGLHPEVESGVLRTVIKTAGNKKLSAAI